MLTEREVDIAIEEIREEHNELLAKHLVDRLGSRLNGAGRQRDAESPTDYEPTGAEGDEATL